MSGDEVLTFQMGLYEAELPTRLRYSDIHFWFETQGEATRCGLSAFASRLLGDVFRLEWEIKVGDELGDAATLGEIESTKATSELYSPFAGTVLKINEEVVEDPSAIAHEPYAAWLIEFAGKPVVAMSAEEYKTFLAEGWEETEKLLKGQL